MNAEEAAIYTLLVGTASITSKIGTYGGNPAVFTGEAPEQFDTEANAFVVLNGVAAPIWDTHDTPGYQTMIDVRCYAPRTGSVKELNALTQAVREAIHWASPSVTGRVLVNLAAIGVSILPEETHVVGRVVTAQMTTQEA